ncbi:MAG: FKBP-type peptidyl-prolyl cis-trans isomerase [Oligoflexales bacterium]
MNLLRPELILLMTFLFSCEKGARQSSSIEQAPAMPINTSSGQALLSDKNLGELGIKDLKQGKGAEAQQNQTLRVSYKAFFESGILFDSSEKRGKVFTFTLGEGTVIKGWEIGLSGMTVGSLRRLTIPPHLAYGEKGISGLIPPGSTLIFEVELLAIEGS